MKKETQYTKIYNFVKANGSITPKQAFPLGITKLATRISEMTRSGKYSVQKKWIKEDGDRFMQYSRITKKRRPKDESK